MGGIALRRTYAPSGFRVPRLIRALEAHLRLFDQEGEPTLAVPTSITWTRDPHTAAKHAILRGYLNAWWPILLQGYGSATFAEGFAGPGEYRDGEDGSPLEALHALLKRDHPLPGQARLVLVEDHTGRANHLNGVIADRYPTLPPNVSVQVKQGACAQVLSPALTAAGAWDQPMFVNLDPFNAEVPYDLVCQVAANPASEVFITFMSQWLTRWAEDEDQDQGDITFGGPMWREVARQPTELKKRFLVDTYKQRLRDAGFVYALAFELVNKQGTAFFLVHGTSSKAGVEKMKEAMWAVDPVYGLGFRDPRDRHQIAFEIQDEADLASLTTSLTEHMGDAEMDVGVLRDWTLTETPYLGKHAVRLLTRWRDEGRLATSPTRAIRAGTLVALRDPPPSADQPALF